MNNNFILRVTFKNGDYRAKSYLTLKGFKIALNKYQRNGKIRCINKEIK